MHELSLVQTLMDQLEQLATQHGATEIHLVKMEIGPLSGVVVDSFEFGFEALKKENPLTQQATLEVTIPTVAYRCLDCHSLTEPLKHRPQYCPHCQQQNLYPEGGDQLILAQVEME